MGARIPNAPAVMPSIQRPTEPAAKATLVPRRPSLIALLQANQRLLVLHNHLRRDHRKPGLRLDLRLVRAAARQASDLAAHDLLTHAGFDGASLVTRLERVGYAPIRVAENAAVQWPLPPSRPDPRTPELVLDGWWSSPAHRGNLLGSYSDFGAAYADTPRGKRYWVAIYAQRSPSKHASESTVAH